MKKLKCNKYGTIINTIPVHCSHVMILNKETNQWGWFMGLECGFINLDEII